MTIFTGTAGKDNIKGTSFDDIMYGGAGDDHLFGRAGNDLIYGGTGSDNLHGGLGNDVLLGEDGADNLHGDAGDDVLAGGADNDFLHGGDGTDTAAYAGSILDYSFSRYGESFYVAHDGSGGPGTGVEGTDHLVHIERLQFGDALIDLTANNAPIGFADTASTDEDAGVYSSGSASVLDNDFDFEGDAMTATAGSFAGLYGTLDLNSDGTYTYTLAAAAQALAQGQVVMDSFTYTVSDGSLSSTSTLTLTVAGLNDAPVAVADSAAGHENETLSIDVLANDSDVDNGATLTLVSGSAPAGKGSASVVAGLLVFDPGADFDRLAQGASETVTLAYMIEDEHGAQASSTVAVTVAGTNDGPVAVADTAAGHENQTLAIDVLANDSDVDDGAVLSVVAASAPAGQGSVSIVADQLVFDPGIDFDNLADGASEIVLLSYTIEDEYGAQASSTVTVTVSGTNDAPVAVADMASGHENQTISINVLANDSDVDDGATLSLVSASTPAGEGSAAVVAGQVAFDPGTDFDYLAVGESASVTVAYTIEDEHGAQASATVAVTVTGTNDTPTIDVGNTSATGSVAELPDDDAGENVFVHQESGSIAFDDVDLSDIHSASFAAQGGGYLGTFTLDPVDQAGDSVGWDFQVSDAALDDLEAGEILTQTYSVTVSDGNGGTVAQDVTITIAGAFDENNVAPDAMNDSYSAIGNVGLVVPAATGLLANDQEFAGGTIGGDPGETGVTAYDAVSAQGGTVTVNPDGSFNYQSAAGFSGTDSFTYTITDPGGLMDTATVTINVGAPVWFIDNSALGSANLGTQADPYTSIAAFNAAQGTVNGPAAGETIYLREGTGSYAEADGINLLNGQTLVGGGQDLVIGADIIETGTGRPTIVTTGAANHGVELAQNNNVSGFDIGATTGAGLSDGGGTVGNLTVSDVGKSGTGQIIDIDQGGTINVTLNSAASLASSGGAIDLNGLGGSFSVAGATNIAGMHSGGGVDITGSSLGVAFQGSTTVSTGTANAISYVGNAGGSLAIAAGLDVDTTSGTGLLVETGGTVTVTGAGNSVTSTTGSSVVIRNATSGGVTLESVSSSGGSGAGIILENAGSGGFAVTGIASLAGSGGSISGKSGADGSLTQGSGIVVSSTVNVSLSNMAISNHANFGILGTNVTNFTLRDSAVTGVNGSSLGLNEGSVSFAGLTGAALFEGNLISGGRADNVRIVNGGGNLALTLQDSASDAAVIGLNDLNGADGMFLQTSGSGQMTLLIDGVDFLGARGDVLQINALGTSSQDITIRNSSFDNVHANIVGAGGGVVLAGGGAGSNIDIDYVIEDSSFRGAEGNALTANYTHSAGAVTGVIRGNVVGLNDGVAGSEGSAGGGDGIVAGLERAGGSGNASYRLEILDNEIYDVALGLAGMAVRSTGGGPDQAIVEATIAGNTITEMGEFTFAGLYALVGGSAGSGDFAELGLSLSDNLFELGASGGNAIYLDQISSDAHYYLPGYLGSPDGEFMGGTASADIDAYLAGLGNVMINGGFASFPGGVDAGFVLGVAGAPLIL